MWTGQLDYRLIMFDLGLNVEVHVNYAERCLVINALGEDVKVHVDHADMRTLRLWPCDIPRTPRKPRREYRLVIIDLHIKRRNSIGWCMLQVLP